MKLTDLDTPAVLIDLDKLERNVQRMAAFAKAQGINLRPHHCCPVKAENAFWSCLNRTVFELTFQGQISRLFDHGEMLIT